MPTAKGLMVIDLPFSSSCSLYAWSTQIGRMCFVLTLSILSLLCSALDDQTQVDSKPAGDPEHASLNQCQLIAANSQKNGALGTPSWWWR